MWTKNIPQKLDLPTSSSPIRSAVSVGRIFSIPSSTKLLVLLLMSACINVKYKRPSSISRLQIVCREKHINLSPHLQYWNSQLPPPLMVISCFQRLRLKLLKSSKNIKVGSARLTAIPVSMGACSCRALSRWEI